MQKRSKLVFKIVMLTSIIFILMTSTLSSFLFWGIFKRTIQNSKNSLENRIEKESNAVYGNLFNKIEVISEEYAALLMKIPLGDFTTLESISETFIGSQKEIVGGGYWLEYYTIKDKKYYGPYWYADGNAIKLTWDYGNEKNDYTQCDWYKNDGLKSGKKIVWSDLYNDSVTNVPMLTATSPLVRDGKKIGVVTIDIGLKELTDYVTSIEVTEVSDYSLSLLTKKGVCIASKDPALKGKIPYDMDFTGEKSGIYDGDGQLILYTPIASTGLVLALRVPMMAIVAPVVSSLIFNFILATLFILAAILFMIFSIHRMITLPLNLTMATLKDIFGGETTDLSKRLEMKAKDEIGEMSGYFNMALGKMAELITMIKKEATVLASEGENLSEDMNRSAASINQISANIQSVKRQTVNQAASVTETDATMRQIAQSIEQLSAHIDRQTENVSQSSSAIEQMLANIASVTQTLAKNSDNVKELEAASERGRTDLTTVSENIRDVARESEGLLEISSVIASIANQTNLLAMNAAIEAAHAGESGKGFAVVSDEIRKLAESSGEQAETISRKLKGINDYMGRTTTAAEAVLRQLEDINVKIIAVSEREQGIRAAMDEQNEGSKQILESIGQLNETTMKVKAGSLEMLAGSKEVIKESGNLSRITVEVTGSMNEITAGVEDITKAMERVKELSQSNKESIDVLASEIGKFKAE